MATIEKWIFTADQLANSPSRKRGIKAELELNYRQQSACLISDMGQLLSVTQLCVNTAIVMMHRFYMHHSFSNFHRNAMAEACLFLAVKSEEQIRKLEHIIKASHTCLHRNEPMIDITSPAFQDHVDDLIFNENILLQTLGFEVTIMHPHRAIVIVSEYLDGACQKVYGGSLESWQSLCRKITHTAYALVGVSLQLTMLCLQYKPEVVACLCVQLTCRWADFQLPAVNDKPWFHAVNLDLTGDQLKAMTDDFAKRLNRCDPRMQKRWLILKEAAVEYVKDVPVHCRISSHSVRTSTHHSIGTPSFSPSDRTDATVKSPNDSEYSPFSVDSGLHVTSPADSVSTPSVADQMSPTRAALATSGGANTVGDMADRKSHRISFADYVRRNQKDGAAAPTTSDDEDSLAAVGDITIGVKPEQPVAVVPTPAAAVSDVGDMPSLQAEQPVSSRSAERISSRTSSVAVNIEHKAKPLSLEDRNSTLIQNASGSCNTERNDGSLLSPRSRRDVGPVAAHSRHQVIGSPAIQDHRERREVGPSATQSRQDVGGSSANHSRRDVGPSASQSRRGMDGPSATQTLQDVPSATQSQRQSRRDVGGQSASQTEQDIGPLAMQSWQDHGPSSIGHPPHSKSSHHHHSVAKHSTHSTEQVAMSSTMEHSRHDRSRSDSGKPTTNHTERKVVLKFKVGNETMTSKIIDVPDPALFNDGFETIGNGYDRPGNGGGVPTANDDPTLTGTKRPPKDAVASSTKRPRLSEAGGQAADLARHGNHRHSGQQHSATVARQQNGHSAS